MYTLLPQMHQGKCSLARFAMIYHMSKEVARNRADTMPALPAVVNAAVAAKYDRADRGDADIYIMMSVCLFVCNEKSSLPPGSLL